jgi:hypothetical protein
VSGDDDVIGLVAYSIYKQDKRDFLVQWREQHGASPNPAQVQAFVATVLTPGQQQRYRIAARTILDAFADASAAAARPEIVSQAVTERIETAARAVEDAGVWHRQIPAGVISAFVYTILLIAIVFVLRYAGVDLESIFDQIGRAPAS